jgi:hypothetical protein
MVPPFLPGPACIVTTPLASRDCVMPTHTSTTQRKNDMVDPMMGKFKLPLDFALQIENGGKILKFWNVNRWSK